MMQLGYLMIVVQFSIVAAAEATTNDRYHTRVAEPFSVHICVVIENINTVLCRSSQPRPEFYSGNWQS